MKKDSYKFLKHKILAYFYGIFKCKYRFEIDSFEHYIGHDFDNYIVNVLAYMKDEGLIQDFTYTKAFGGDLLMRSRLDDIRITPKGIECIEE